METAPIVRLINQLKTMGRIGWYRGGPISEHDYNVVPTTNFHVHPEDVNNILKCLTQSIEVYGGSTRWYIKVSKENRFYLCPESLVEFAEVQTDGMKLNSNVAFSISNPDAGIAANRDLHKLVDYLAKNFG